MKKAMISKDKLTVTARLKKSRISHGRTCKQSMCYVEKKQKLFNKRRKQLGKYQ